MPRAKKKIQRDRVEDRPVIQIPQPPYGWHEYEEWKRRGSMEKFPEDSEKRGVLIIPL